MYIYIYKEKQKERKIEKENQLLHFPISIYFGNTASYVVYTQNLDSKTRHLVRMKDSYRDWRKKLKRRVRGGSEREMGKGHKQIE